MARESAVHLSRSVCFMCYICVKEEEILDTCGDRAGWPEFHARLLLIRCLFFWGACSRKGNRAYFWREREGWMARCMHRGTMQELFIYIGDGCTKENQSSMEMLE